MTHTLLKKTAFAFGTGCFFGFLALALTTQPANAQTQNAEKSYTAPGESNPTAVAKSKPGKIGGVSVKDKQKQAVVEEVVLVVEEQPKEEVKPQPLPQIKEEPKVQPKEEAKPQPAPQIKEEPKVQPKEEVKPQPAPQIKEEPKAQPKEEAKQKIALETLKKKVAADKTPKKAAKPAKKSNNLVQKVAYGDAVQDWVAKPGDTVQGLLMKWSEESGWTLIWKLDRDYILEAGVVFRGTYMDVAMALLRSFARAMPAPIGTFYKGNRVLVVSTREDENEG